MRSPRPWLFLLVVVLAAGDAWVAFRRSGIPVALDGRVERIDLRREKHPGLDDVYLVTIGPREVHLDDAVARQLAVGEHAHKDAWSTRLETSHGPIALAPSKDTGGMARAMPLLVILALGLLLPRRGTSPAKTPRPLT